MVQNCTRITAVARIPVPWSLIGQTRCYRMPKAPFTSTSYNQHHTPFCTVKMLWVMMLNLVTLRPGFLRLVQGGLRIMEDGALHAGPPCSTWVWINRGTSGRSMQCVMGDSNQPSVLEGNTKLDLMIYDIFFSYFDVVGIPLVSWDLPTANSWFGRLMQ